MATYLNYTDSTRNRKIKEKDIAYRSIDIDKKDIAPLRVQSIKEITTTSETIFGFNKNNDFNSKNESKEFTTNKIKFYKEFNEKALAYLTGKQSTSQWIMNAGQDMTNTLNLNYNMNKIRSYGSYQDAVNGYNGFQEFKNGNKTMWVFDLEALSGTNANGFEDIDQLTEYAFREYNNTGKILKEFTGVIGIDSNTEEKYTKLAKEFKKTGYGDTKSKVALEYFAKLGHKDTQVINVGNGIHKIKTYTSEDAKDIMTEENILAGIERSRKIGKDQEKNTAWLNDLNTAISSVQKSTDNGSSILAGHNIKKYDIPQINKISAKSGVLPLNINSGSVFDTLTLFQHANVNDDFVPNIYTGKRLSYGSTPLAQASLVTSFLGEDYYNRGGMGAHSALADVQAFYDLVTSATTSYGKNVVDQAFESMSEAYKDNIVSGEIKGNSSQLFYGKNASKYDGKIIDFTIDSFSKSIHTSDGIIINNDGTTKKAFNESIIKKGVSYTVDDISKIKMDSEYIKAISSIYPDMAVENLVMVKMSPVIDPKAADYADIIHKNNLSIYRIGTLEDIQSAFDNDMILYGEKDNNGKYQWNEQTGSLLLRKDIVPDENGHLKLKPVSTEINDVISDGTKILMNDSAARSLRDDSYKKYSNLIKLHNELENNIDPESKIEKSTQRKAMLEEMIKQSSEIASGGKLDIASQAKRLEPLQNLIGYKDRLSGKQVVYRHTVDNAIASLNNVESIYKDISTLLEKVDSVGGSSEHKDYLFKLGMDAYKSAVLEKYGNVQNIEQGYVRNYNKNYFDIDVSSMSKDKNYTTIGKSVDKVNPDDILTINLEPGSEYNLISKVNKLNGVKSTSYNKEVEAKTRLDMLVNLLHENNTLSSKQVEAIKEGDRDAYTVAHRIIAHLNDVKKENPAAGILKQNNIQSVISGIKNAKNGSILPKNKLDEIFSFLGNEEHSSDKFMKINPGNSESAIESREKVVNEIMERYFAVNLPTNKILSEQYGYSDVEISKMRSLVNVHVKDTKRFLKEFINGVSEAGGSIYADNYLEKMGIIYKDKFYDTSFIPKLKFQDGMLYTKVGTSAAAAFTKVSFDGNGFGIHSGLGEAMGKWFNLKSTVENAKTRNEDPIEVLFNKIKKVANKVRSGAENIYGSSSVARFDEQDVKSQFETSVSGVVDKFPELKELGFFDDIEMFKKDEFMENIDKTGFNHKNMSYESDVLLQRNLPAILNKIKDYTENDDIKVILDGANYHAKGSAAEKGRVRTSDIHYGWDQFINGSRGITEQSRLTQFSRKRTEKYLANNGLSKEIFIGSSVMTRVGRAISERTYAGMGKSASEIMVSRNSLSSMEISEKLNKLINSGSLSKEEIGAAKILSNKLNIAEAGAVADARIADNIFTSYDIQKVASRKILTDAHHANVETLKNISKIVPSIKISKDGKVQFEYSAGKLIEEGDTIGYTEGYGSTEKITAKNTGILSFGFFDKGKNTLVDEANVKKAVKDYAKNHNRVINNIDEWTTIAENIFDGNYYIENLEAKSLKKLLEDRAEKHMTSFAYVGLGASGNNKIGTVLRELGLDNIIGKEINFKIFEQFKSNDITKTILPQLSNKTLDNDIYKNIVEKNFGSVDDFYNAILRERYLASDILKSVEVAGASIVSQVDPLKHKTSVAAVQAGINEMLVNRLKSGMSEKKAHKDIVNTVGKYFIGDNGEEGLTIGKDGKMELSRMSYEGGGQILYKDLEGKIREDIGAEKWDKILAPGSVTYHTYGDIGNDWKGTSINKAKISSREYTLLGAKRFDERSMSVLEQAMGKDKFNEVFNHAYDDNGNLIKRPVLESYMNQLKQDAKSRDGYKEDLKVFKSGTMAIDYNVNGKNSEELKKAGFFENTINLSELKTPTGNDAEYIDRPNMILNLKDHVITDDILSKTNLKNKDHIAIVGNIKSEFGDQAILPEYQKSVNRLVGIRNELEAEMNKTGGGDSKRIERLKDSFVNTVNNISQQQSAYISGNGEDSVARRLETVIADKSAMGKAVIVDQRHASQMMDKAIVDGKSLSQWSKEGVYFDASFKSEDTFRKMGFFDEEYLKTVFGHNEKMWKDDVFNIKTAEDMMRKKLSTEGIIGFTRRYPTIYPKSVNASMIFLGKGLSSNESADTLLGSLFRKEDADGDTPESIIATFTDKHGKKVDQYTGADHVGFKDIKALLYTNAYIDNVNAISEIEKDEKEYAQNFSTQESSRLYNSRVAAKNGDATESPEYIKPRATRGVTKNEFDLLTDEAKSAAIEEQAAGIAAIKRGSAGSINIPLKKIKDVAAIAKEAGIINDKELNSVNVLSEAAEEGFLSPKHESSAIVDNSAVLEEFNKYLNGVIYNSKRNDVDAVEALKGWMHENAYGRIRDKLYQNHDFKGTQEEIRSDYIDTGVDTISKIYENINSISQYNQYFKVGSSSTGIDAGKINEVYNVPVEDSSLHAEVMRDANTAFEEKRHTESRMFSAIKKTSSAMNNENTEGIADEAKETAKRIYYGRQRMSNYTESVANTISEAVKKHNISSKGIAMGAVGLAGAIMVAGFSGGNPSTPNQQEGRNAAETDGYNVKKIPTLTDTNVMKSSGNGPTRGYVININAQSPGGRANAEAAIQTAMGATVSRSNVNIAMNINDQTGNITNSRRQNDDVLDYIQTLF